jgi:hypothetical protein
MKVCPKCKRTWPDKGKFCPMDGTALVAESPPQAGADKDTLELPPGKAGKAEAKAVKEPRWAQAAAGKPASKADAGEVATKPMPEPAPGAAPEKKGGKSKRFSETKWFMMGDQIQEDDLGPENLRVEELQEKYRKTAELPPEVRRKYSLNYDGTEAKDKP